MPRRLQVSVNFLALLIGGALSGLFGAYWLMRYIQPRHSPMILNNAVIVITGASSGIGRAFAESFAQRGARLVLVARRVDRLEALRLAIAPYAAEVLVIAADVSTPAGRAAIIDGTLAHFGQIDAIVNNAGVYVAGPLETLTGDDVDSLVEVNLGGTIGLTRLVLPSMLNRRSGLIIHVASVAGRVASPGQSVYGATKHGLLAFSTALRRELIGTGVSVVTVLPEFVNTEMLTPALIDWLHQIGLPLIEPHTVSATTIAGLLKGQSEIYVSGWKFRAVMWGERHFPAVMSVAWRAMYTPLMIAALRSTQSDE